MLDPGREFLCSEKFSAASRGYFGPCQISIGSQKNCGCVL